MEATFKTCMKRLAKTIEATDWDDKKKYGAFLAHTYYYVCHSTRLLALAASRFPLNQDKLHYRFLAHISEETRHEILATKDLENLGFKIGDFPETPATQAFYQCQYFQIEHLSSASFLGYVLMLEGLAVEKGAWLCERVTKKHGTKAAAFLKVHANEDIEHLEKAFDQIKHLGEIEKSHVSNNLILSCHLYNAVLEGLSKGDGKTLTSAA
jgi:thiaminase